jgi:hypothetical protein
MEDLEPTLHVIVSCQKLFGFYLRTDVWVSQLYGFVWLMTQLHSNIISGRGKEHT